MNQHEQINRLVKKGLFNKRLKERKQRRELIKTLKITGSALSILIILLFLVQLIPTSSIEVSSEIKKTEEKSLFKAAPIKKLNIFKSLISLNIAKEGKSAINILALGKPGQGYPGGSLTDTIILVHLKPDQKKAVLISIPRDLLVKLPSSNQLTKINSLYNSVGIEGLKQTITEITNLSVDHHILIDLAVVKEVINLVDGLNVYVPQDINDSYFPGPNYTYQAFIMPIGWRYMDGELALKYIRTRYTSPNGDFDRMARQQQVIQLLKQKVLSLNPLWNFTTYLKIFNTLSNHIETDLNILEMRSFYQTARDLKTDQIISLVIDKKETNLLVGGQVMFGNQRASVVYPKIGQGNYTEIEKYIKDVIE